MKSNTISILMPVKDGARFLQAAVESVARTCPLDWQLVIVDDHSQDATLDIAEALAERWPQVIVLRNEARGKISALNTAYHASNGEIVGTLDADDCIRSNFWGQIAAAADTFDCFTRDAYLIDSRGRHIGVLRLNRNVISQSFEAAATELTGLPRWTWTFSRKLADRVFPIPDQLPFEDVWFSLVLKRFACNYAHFRKPSYLYRQHENQTYGGVLNYDPAIVRFRSWRLVQYAEVLPDLCSRLALPAPPDLREVATYHRMLASRRMPFVTLLSARIRLSWKIKAMLFRRAPRLAAIVKRLQWVLDSMRSERPRQ